MKKTYGKLDFIDGKWVLDDLPPFVSIKLKSIFSNIAKYNHCPFDFRDTPAVANDLDWFLQRYPVLASDDVKERLKNKKEEYLKGQEDLYNIFTKDYASIVPKLRDGYELRKYQVEAVNLILKNKRLLLGDDTGVGKSHVALGVACSGRIPLLLVCQSHLVKQWRRVAGKFTNLRVHEILVGKHYKLPVADIYITKYTMLDKWLDIIINMGLKAIVFDEAQELRRSDSNKYRAAKNITNIIETCILMTATPVYNYADEIFNIMQIVKPELLASREEFNREWCGFKERVQDPKALGAYLRDSFFFLRRTKKDVGLEMEKVNTIVHTVGFDNKEILKVEERAEMLAQRMFTGSFVERGQAARDLDLLMRQATGIGKAKDVAAYCRVFLENNIPIILALWHRDCYNIILEELKEFNPVMYTGSESPKEKDASVAKFVHGATNLFLLSLRSGIGIDGLQERCSTVIFGEFDWSPPVHLQVIGRVDRPGQVDPVTAIYLTCDEGSDPVMLDLLADKKTQSDGVMNPLQGAEYVGHDDSRIKLLAKEFLRRRGKMVNVD